MAYREPGVYTEIINSKPLTGSTPNMIPLIIGEGPKYFEFLDKAIVRSSDGDTDVLPSTTVTAITKVYTVSGGVETVIPATGNYTLTAPNIVTWTLDSTAKPSGGTTYYVNYQARPEATQYLPTYISSFDALATAYSGMLMKTTSEGAATTINPVYLGAYLALESGCSGVYVIQVEPMDKATYDVVIGTDIVGALSKATGINDAYFLVPMTSNSAAVGATITHCNLMTTTLERKERVCFVSSNIQAPAASTGIFTDGELTTAVGIADSYRNKLVRTPFVTSATKILSDGVLHDLTGEYVCAAIAGLAAVIPVSQALTRQSLYNFMTIKHVTGLRRSDKNRLAEVGFIVLEQAGGVGTPVSIRHGITTKTDSVEDREHSIVTSLHFTAKYLRASLEGYIGKYNIDSFLPTKISGTITACKNYLVRNTVMTDVILGGIAQDEYNPDTLLISISVKPMYPCNYINLDILIE